MTKRKRLLIFAVLLLLLAVGYVKLFYKTYSYDTVPRSADCIAVIDVKRVTNTLIWNFITTPAKWKFNRKKQKKDVAELDEVFNLPDYLFAFHPAGQPAGAFYILLRIKDEAAFAKAASFYGLERRNESEFINERAGIRLFKKGNAVIAGNALVNEHYFTQTADELFIRKAFASKEIVSELLDARSHLAVYFSKGFFSKNAFVVKGNFDDESVTLSATLTPGEAHQFSEAPFNYSRAAPASAGFTQSAVAGLLKDSSMKNALSKITGVDADSFFRPVNTRYALEITGLFPRIDSAVTYDYDDDFNRIEKVTLNTVEEPAFSFAISSGNAAGIFSYLQTSGKTEKTPAGDLFLPVPFVRSYCTIADSNLVIRSDNYRLGAANEKAVCVFFLNLVLEKMPAVFLHYFPEVVRKMIAATANVKLSGTKAGAGVRVEAVVKRKGGGGAWFGM